MVHLTLPPTPQAPGEARRWVRRELADRRQLEVADAALLGVSELVTNCLMHVRSEIVVRVVAEDGQPLRLEVDDHSPDTPRRTPPSTGQPGDPATVGRGLRILAAVSSAWGVDSLESGKRVWFVPLTAAQDVVGGPGSAHGHADVADNLSPASVPRQLPPLAQGQGHSHGHGSLDFTLVDTPVTLLAHYRTRFNDLRREMTLIALAGEAGSSVPQRLTTIATHLDRYRHYTAGSATAIERAAAQGRDRVTSHFTLPREVVGPVAEMHHMLHEADEYCRARELLTLALGPQARALRDWVYGDIVRQAHGFASTPWQGEFTVTDPDPSRLGAGARPVADGTSSR
ncbi:MAG: ATP-binding protein [Nocardioidaceae bacterium]